MMNAANVYREGNINNIRAILNSKKNFTPEECCLLGECFTMLSKDDINLRDSVMIEKMCSRFGVLLPF